jgi:hypothetical protein
MAWERDWGKPLLALIGRHTMNIAKFEANIVEIHVLYFTSV